MLAIRYDPDIEEPNPADMERGCTIGLLQAENFVLAPGKNLLHLRGALINPDSMPEMNHRCNSDEVRQVAGIYFTKFVKFEPTPIGIVGFSARNEFRARKAWKDAPPSTLPELPIIRWLDTSIQALANVVVYTQDPQKGKLDIEKVNI